MKEQINTILLGLAVVLLVVLLGLQFIGGGNDVKEERLNNAGNQQRQNNANENIEVQGQQGAGQGGETDKYGRTPDEEHYGHDHPPLNQQKQQQQQSPNQQQNNAGETDEYGRSPGDEHYGHDHP